MTTPAEVADELWQKLDAIELACQGSPGDTLVAAANALVYIKARLPLIVRALRALGEPSEEEVERAAEAVAVVVASIDCDNGPKNDPTGMEACRRVARAALKAARAADD